MYITFSDSLGYPKTLYAKKQKRKFVSAFFSDYVIFVDLEVNFFEIRNLYTAYLPFAVFINHTNLNRTC